MEYLDKTLLAFMFIFKCVYLLPIAPQVKIDERLNNGFKKKDDTTHHIWLYNTRYIKNRTYALMNIDCLKHMCPMAPCAGSCFE